MRILKVLMISVSSTIIFPITVQTVWSGTTERINLSSAGEQANEHSLTGSISANGRFVLFSSHANNLVPGDTNGFQDAFIHDRQTDETTRVSVSSGGEQGNEESYNYPSSISADGRFVAFNSYANNLVPGDTNGRGDIFVHDSQTGETTRVSVSSEGEQGDKDSSWSSISANGRFVAFTSWANNLVPGERMVRGDVFVHDRQTGQTTRVSVSSDGEQGNNESYVSSISADGRFVAFVSDADNLVPGDTNGFQDVFVHDRKTGQTSRVSVSSGGEQGNEYSTWSFISANGRFVAFSSAANNLVPDDTNGFEDAYIHDHQTGQTSRVSVSSGGEQGNDGSGVSSISADGRFVAFSSAANNLVPGDTNGEEDVFVHDRFPELLGRAEIIGTWSNGIWYWDFVASIWTQMTVSAPPGDIAAGDFTGDGKADVASIWGNGLWYQDGDTLDWTKVSNTAPTQVTVGDVTGDGRSEIIGTWSNGIWYWDFVASIWTQMTVSTPPGDISAGDFTSDGKADVASCWSNGLWYQDGATLDWNKISNAAPTQVTVGDVTGDGRSEIIGTWSNGIWYWDFVASIWTQMTVSAPPGDIAAGDFTGDGKADVASIWDNGLWYQDGATLDWTKVSNTAPGQLASGDITGY